MHGETSKTEHELKKKHQQKLKAAALAFVEGSIATKDAALQAQGLCHITYRQSMDYQVKVAQKFYASIANLPALYTTCGFNHIYIHRKY